MKKVIALCSICIMLTGCSTLMSALSSLGGGTTSKGHGNDNELVIGSDVTKGVSTGDKTEIETDDVHGDVTNGAKTTTGDNKGNVTVGDKKEYNADVISFGLNWWQALVIALIAGLVIPSPLSLLRRRNK
jgi:hypothetical protein